MNGRLISWEFKKILEQPMIIIFLFLCLIFNTILILSTDFDSDYTNYIENVRESNGNYVTDELKMSVEQLPITAHQQHLLNDLAETKDIYTNYDMTQLGEEVNEKFDVKGSMKDRLVSKYKKLQPVVEQLSETQAGFELAAAGQTMSYFTYIRYRLVRIILVECITFAVLIGLFSSTSEQLTKTTGTLLTTKIGRNIQISKYLAGLAITSIFFLFVTITSVGLFSTYHTLGTIWQSSISTQFHLNSYAPIGFELPFMTWLPMTLLTYTGYSFLFVAILTLLCFSFHFQMGLWLGNLFKGFVLIVGVFSAHLVLVSWSMKTGLWLVFEALMWSPLQLWTTQPHWFTEMAVYETVPFQEVIVLAFFAMVLVFGTVLTRIYYPRKEVF